LELRHLRAFVALAETLHFGKAAERLHLSQPPLSRQIRQLEDQLGVALFARSTQRVELTEAGRAFLPEARGVLAQTERAISAARAAGRGEVLKLEVGYLIALDHGPVAQIIAAFRAASPGVTISIAHMSSLEQVAALRDGRIDIGFARLPIAHRGLSCLTVGSDNFVAVLPTAHPLAKKRRIDLLDLRDEGFVMLETRRHPNFQAATLDVCRVAGLTPRITHESESLQNIVVMVASGLGIGLVPASVAAFRAPGVVFRPLKGAAGELAVESGLLWRPRDPSPVVADFVACVRAYLGGHEAA
jgi:DNA-binding transcriptional LysR family regulator